jgi:hypothetical protein
MTWKSIACAPELIISEAFTALTPLLPVPDSRELHRSGPSFTGVFIHLRTSDLIAVIEALAKTDAGSVPMKLLYLVNPQFRCRRRC